jgi:predicted dehydrogenase|tara:strand:+ start:195 stop:341 length:147 start_codon:yes stop_codon:yes gene_type:complete
MAEFADCIRNHAQAEVDGHIGLHNQAVVLAAAESNKKGEAITLASLGL